MGKHKDVYRNYFPYTECCPIDGKKCVDSNCKLFLGEKRCWCIEFDNLVRTAFNSEDVNYIHFKDEEGHFTEGLRHLSFYFDHSEKLGKEPSRMEARIGCNSYRLALKVKEKFKLNDWEVTSVNEDGGDDADLIKTYAADSKDRNELVEIFKMLESLAKQIIVYEKEVNNCALCKEHGWSLNEYVGVAICAGCENRIIIENIAKYL